MMDLDHGFDHLVTDTARLFTDRFDERANLLLGLTRSQCRILGCLAANEGINQANLADLLDIKPMTLVRQIDRMEQAGWIERRADPADRRARQLQLTAKSRPLLACIRRLSGQIRHEAFAGLSHDDGNTLMVLLHRVHRNLAGPAGLDAGGKPLSLARQVATRENSPPPAQPAAAAVEDWR